ncbi:hypothetical protein BH24DEI2_BH24DEI2_03390 [soil metagenome]
MKKVTFYLCLAFFLTAFSFSAAQDNTMKLAYVYTSQLFAANPAGQAAAGLLQQRDDELGPLVQELQGLQSKAETAEGLTADERARANLLVRTVQQTQARYTEDIRQAAAPAEAAINEAIAAVAKAGGYTLVLDAELTGAGGSSPFIFVDRDIVPDITAEVIAQLTGQ